jgi:hypothetical protein
MLPGALISLHIVLYDNEAFDDARYTLLAAMSLSLDVYWSAHVLSAELGT